MNPEMLLNLCSFSYLIFRRTLPVALRQGRRFLSRRQRRASSA